MPAHSLLNFEIFFQLFNKILTIRAVETVKIENFSWVGNVEIRFTTPSPP